ncbi:outer membrane beta-barrel protein [Marinimicrobium locisalis]|uniref:outer membrane beta-barrel protein n=1 Tax=Marinimicrobium locisalis TaxID=546022 RepID=UPI003221B3AB
MKKTVLATALVCAAGAAQAAEQPEWNQLGVAYQSAELGNESLNGFALTGSALISEQAFVVGSFARASDEVLLFGESIDLDLDTTSLGLGFRHPLSVNTDFFAVVSYEKIKATAYYRGQSGSASDNGFGLTGGFRSMLSEAFEVNGSLGYVSIDDESETTVSIGADYYLTPTIAVGVAYSTFDDLDTTSLGVTFVF